MADADRAGTASWRPSRRPSVAWHRASRSCCRSRATMGAAARRCSTPQPHEARGRRGARARRPRLGVEPGPAYGGLLALLRPLEPNLDELAAPEQSPPCSPRSRSAASRSTRSTSASVCSACSPARPSEGRSCWPSTTPPAVDPASTSAITFALARLGVDRDRRIPRRCRPTTISWDEVVTKRVVLGPLGMADLATIVEHATDCTPEAAAGLCRLGGRESDAGDRAGQLAVRRRAAGTIAAAGGPAGDRCGPSNACRSASTGCPSGRGGRSSWSPPSRSGRRLASCSGALAALGEPVGGLDEAEDAGIFALDGDEAAFTHPLLAPALLPPRRRVQPARRAPRPGRRARPNRAGRRRARRGTSPKRASALTTTSPPRSSWLPPTPGGVARSPSRPRRSNGRPRCRSIPGRGRRRRRAAAVAALDGFDFDDALRLVDPADRDDEAALLAIEAIERRDGESAALAVLAAALLTARGTTCRPTCCSPRAVAPTPREARRCGRCRRRARCSRERGHRPVRGATARPGRRRPPSGAGRTGDGCRPPASRGVAVDDPTSVDELVAAAKVAESRGDAAAARDLVERALAAIVPTTRVPAGSTSLGVLAKRFDDGRRDDVRRAAGGARVAHQGRAPGRRVGGGGAHQPRGRRPPVRERQDGRLPPAGDLPQAGGAFAHGTGGLDGPHDDDRRPSSIRVSGGIA